MKKSIFLFFVLLFVSCKENFQTWKDYNDDFLKKQTSAYQLKSSNDGLRYKPIYDRGPSGEPKPKRNSIVHISYSAVLCDGTICTSLDTVDYVYNYPLGVQNALLQMQKNWIWQLCIPYDLAYGVSGTKNTYGNYIIPPYSTIFIKTLELKEVINY